MALHSFELVASRLQLLFERGWLVVVFRITPEAFDDRTFGAGCRFLCYSTVMVQMFVLV